MGQLRPNWGTTTKKVQAEREKKRRKISKKGRKNPGSEFRGH